MPVKAIRADYHGDMKDSVDKFHGRQLLNIGWDRHLMYATPLCIPVPPSMPFGALVDQVLPGLYGQHEEFGRIDWAQVRWRHGSEPFIPDLVASLADNGLVHQSVLRFSTPGLEGLYGAAF